MLMPVMDGLEAARQLRQSPELQEVPIVAMTANAYADDRARRLAAGMDDFLTWPVLPGQLHAAVLFWLAGKWLREKVRIGAWQNRALAGRHGVAGTRCKELAVMEQVKVDREGAILVMRLVRSEKYNALSPQMYGELAAALAELNRDPELRAAVLHAEGKHFTAGIELDQWAPVFRSGTGFRAPPGGVDPFGLSGPRHAKPLILAVQGYCFTWGVELLLNAEIRIAAVDTQFQMLEVQRGLFPCAGATIRLPREIGWGNACKVLLTGDRWSADDALRWGMVQDVVAPGEQFARAMDYARKIAQAAPLGVQGVMREARAALVLDHDSAVDQMVRNLVPVMNSEDSAEGVRSFVERRAAVFTGR